MNEQPDPSSAASASVQRLLDANANRAREGLRVVEDFARFVLDDVELCAALKQLRHDLAAATRPFLEEAILNRDTQGDVGTQISTAAEMHRADLADVVMAAAKRLGEALRCLEEYSKIDCPESSRQIEAIRYRFYAVEQSLARQLPVGGAGSRFADVRLYVLITESVCRGKWLTAAEEAIAGGADCLQLREKELESGEFLRRAREFVALCRRHRVLSIINDRPDIALLSGADGVHLGQEDLPAIEARKLLGREKIIGVSTHRIEQARQAVRDGADYVGVGPVFRSATKARDFVAGLDYARLVAREIRIPAVAIAGITVENVDQVLAAGLRAVAVTAAVVGCENVKEAASAMKRKLQSRAACIERAESPAHSPSSSIPGEGRGGG